MPGLKITVQARPNFRYQPLKTPSETSDAFVPQNEGLDGPHQSGLRATWDQVYSSCPQLSGIFFFFGFFFFFFFFFFFLFVPIEASGATFVANGKALEKTASIAPCSATANAPCRRFR